MLNTTQAHEWIKQADGLMKQAQYAQAIELLDPATALFEAAEDYYAYVQCLNKHSECLFKSGKYNEGQERAEKALAICLERWGEDHEETANIYNGLGSCYRGKGGYAQAITYHQQALNIYLKIFGEQHLYTARSYNGLGSCYRQKGEYAQAIAYHQQALSIWLTTLGEQHPNTAMSYNNLGNCYSQKGEYAQAITYHQQALSIWLTTLGEQHPNTAMSYNNLGVCYRLKGDYTQAIACDQQALNIRLATLVKRHPDIGMSYNNLGICYRLKGDYTQAITYNQQALNIRIAALGKQHPYTASSYNSLGSCYWCKGDYAQAINYHQKELNVRLATLGKQHPNTANSYAGLGNCYHDKGDYTQAITYYQQALSYLTTLSEQHPRIANSYNNLGSCYYYKGDYDQAIAYYQQALSIYLTTFGEQHPYTAMSYNNLGNCYREKGDYTQAITYHQQALQALALPVSDTDCYPLPTLEGYNYNGAIQLLDILPAKADTFFALYQQNQAAQDLAAALAHYHCADALIDQMRQSYKTEGSKLTLAAKSKTKVYDAGLNAAFVYEQLHSKGEAPALDTFNTHLGYTLPTDPIDLAFHFSEKSKAVLLFAGMKDAEARLAAQLPPDLVQQEYNLRVELTYLERRISEEGYQKPEEQDTAALAEWQSLYFGYKQQYDALIQGLETDFPDYYRLKYDIGTATIAQIQAFLPPQTALISYVLSEQHLYIITLTAQKSHWQQTALPTDFEGLVEDFLLSFPQIGKSDYLTYGYDLYRHLLQPIAEAGLLAGIERLIIIPDGILSRLPFEALPTAPCPEQTSYQNIPYMLRQYKVSYHYSATLWVNQQDAKMAAQPSTSSGFIGFAPVYSDTVQNKDEHEIDLTIDDDFYEKMGIEKPEEKHRINYFETAEAVRSIVEGRNFVELKHSETEVRQAADLFYQCRQNAKVLLHKAATLDQFKALSGNYRYLLIAAHADYNGQKPDQTGIIFSPNESDGNGIFYMGDAYNLQLQADLVVLSCCETGLGYINKGEGTMALNRGFLYSGAKNVVHTLFKVYDKESSELTTELFRELLKNEAPIAALHQAKLHLIARGLMPNKWAGYVLVGE